MCLASGVCVLFFVFFLCSFSLQRILSFSTQYLCRKLDLPVFRASFDLLRCGFVLENFISNESLTQSLNTNCHASWQFSHIRIRMIRVALFPRICVTLEGVDIEGFTDHPHSWSLDDLLHSLRSARCSVLNQCTTRILKRLQFSSSRFETLSYLCQLPVDLLIASASVVMRDVSVGICSRKSMLPTDVLLVAQLEQLLATPSGSFYDYIFSNYFQVCAYYYY